jgi:hypothetical protein
VADAIQLATFCLTIPVALGVGVLMANAGGVCLGSISGLVAFFVFFCIGCNFADRVHNPLPEGIERFSDLARLIVEQRQQTSP